MKIALVSSFFEPQTRGGAAASVHMLARGLAKQGMQVVVITTHPERRTMIQQTDCLTLYRVFPWNLYWIGDKNIQPIWKRALWQIVDVWNPHAFWILWRILERERPDIVHVNKLRGLSPAIWAASSHASGSPIVQTCRDYELMSPEGTLAGRVGAWAENGAWFIRPYQVIRARFSRAVAAATAPSSFALEMITRRGFFPFALKQVVPNSHGLSLRELDQHRKELQANYRSMGLLRLLYLGRLEEIKGVDLLCAAFERCAARFSNLHLDIAGWGPLERELQQRYGKHPQITFHGPVFGDDKVRLLTESAVLVVPSVCPEVFGNVIAEAYAYGKPVIATRSGGIPELIEEGRTGILTSPQVEFLVEAITQAAENPGSLHQMAQACFEAASQYTVEVVVNKYTSVYERLLK